MTAVSCVSTSGHAVGQSSKQNTDSSIDQRMADEPAARSSEATVKRAADVMTNAEGLTSYQKKELRIIYLQTYKDAIPPGLNIVSELSIRKLDFSS